MKSRIVTMGLRILVGLTLGLAAVIESGATTFSEPGFSQQVVASGLTDPTAFAFFPDGRIAIAQKSGVVRLVKNGTLLPTPLVDISERVNDYWDRGLLGIAVDPSFASQPYVYLLYTYENDGNEYDGPKTARLGRFTVSGDTASPSSEFVVLGTVVGRSCKDFPVGSDCIPSDGPSHSVGAVKFASDQTMFVTVGDSSSFNFVDPDALRSQNLVSLAGKVLRVTRTGQGVSTNPHWTGNAGDNASKVWASGLRNAYRFNLRPGSEVPYLGDVGWNTREEISVASAGSNLGWPCYEGSIQQSGYAPLAACQALYAATGTEIASLGTPIARVPAPLGGGPNLAVIKDGDKPPVGSSDSSRQYDSWDGNNAASEDWVGYSFAVPHTFNKVVFQEGRHFWDGGWFTTLTVQVRQSGNWVGVSNLGISPAYAGNNGVTFETYTLTFNPIQGDAIRIYGAPGGAAAFISVGELNVFADGGSGGGGGGGGTPVESPVTPLHLIARVPEPLGGGPNLAVIYDGDKPPVGSSDSSRQYDSWDGANAASEDWVGFEFASPQDFTKLVFQEGKHFGDGGWFTTLTVQVRQNGNWVGVSNLAITPAYGGNDGVSFETHTLTFNQIQGDAIRLYGAPGGSAAFISVGELEAFALVTGGSPNPARPPLYDYAHSGSSAVTAGAFYTGSVYPISYQGVYFFGDFADNWLRTLQVNGNDLVPGSVADFADEADGPVDIEMGPDGLIYYLAISANELRRVQYTVGNTPPSAVASATPQAGSPPLVVQFSSAGSLDPDGDPLTFDWNFGDGNTGSGPSPQHTYSQTGVYTAVLTVDDGRGGVVSDSVTITVGNSPPVATISSPSASLLFKVGDVISYSGSATDPDPGQPAPTLAWQIVLHHCPGGSCHAHPFSSGTGGSGTFTVPDHGDESYFEIVLTATDAGGLTHTVSRTIQPQIVQVTVATSPAGLQVIYDGTTGAAPLVRTTIAGSTHTVNTLSPQGSNTFQSWSDGGAQMHQVTVGATNVTYTANFSSPSGCPVGQYQAEYFNNLTLSGTPTFTRCESAINYNWGSGGPGNGIGNDNFSVRWTGRFNFAAGNWRFTTVSDDGVRLYVDGVIRINRWTDHAPTTDTATVSLTAGEHEVKVEYYEKGGGAVIQVSSQQIGVSSCPVGQYRAEYFNNLTLSGTPTFTRCESAINYNWGSGGPGNGIGNDNFSVRWTGQFNFAAGPRTFTTVSDDGVRLYVDNVLRINRWTDHAPTTDTATVSLTAGAHEVKVEYYEKGGGAVIQVSW